MLWLWTEECQTVLSNLKLALQRSPVLTPPNFNKAFKVQTQPLSRLLEYGTVAHARLAVHVESRMDLLCDWAEIVSAQQKDHSQKAIWTEAETNPDVQRAHYCKVNHSLYRKKPRKTAQCYSKSVCPQPTQWPLREDEDVTPITEDRLLARNMERCVELLYRVQSIPSHKPRIQKLA